MRSTEEVTVAEAPPSRRRRWPRRLAVGVAGVLAMALLVAAVLAVWSVRRPFPDTSGTHALAVLDAPVEVHRDELGVPTIVGETERDLMRALGYVHAQDRFWQMDAWRHIGRGRTAELFGDAQLETDRFLRTLGWERIAETELALLDPATREQLEDYSAGVNAYLASRPHRALGLEYTVLGLTYPDYRPRPWEPVDTLAFTKVMAWDLRSNLDAEITRAVLLDELGPELLADLYPSYEASPVVVDAWGPAGDLHDAVGGPVLRELLADVAAAAALPSLAPPGADGVGSNGWVIAGAHTDTGAPMLANDPHLGIQMPSIWHQSALRCAPAADDCDLHVAGFTFAGIPAIVIGHNARIAWGVTNFSADVMDLYVERVNPDNPHQYEVDGEWVDMEVSTEALRSADGTTEELEVRATRNGPIVSDVYGPLDDIDPGVAADAAGAEGAEGADAAVEDADAAVEDTDAAAEDADAHYAFALRWTALEPRPVFDAARALNRAGDWDEFRAALEDWAVPGQNFLYADVDGSIGYQATGVVPIRAGGDGSLPVPGWVEDYQWIDAVPYDDLPSVRDPEEGWIVTANNPAVGDDYPYWLGADWDHGQRAARIRELVADPDRPITLDDVQRQQVDNHQHAADWLVPALAAADPGAAHAADGGTGRSGGADAATAEPDSVGEAAERAARAQALLADWDRRMDADSAGAAVFAATWRHLLAHMFHARLPAQHHPNGGARWFEVVRRLVDEPDAPWWDDPDSARTETRDEALATAAAAGVAELEARLGDDPDDWTWGELHTATFRNQTLGQSGIGLVEDRFNRGPYPVGGSTSIVNAIGWHAAVDYTVNWVPSMRLIVDLADLDRSRGIHTTGQSGHAYHRHYTSMVEPWVAGEQHAMRWDPARVADEADATLRLEPAPGGP